MVQVKNYNIREKTDGSTFVTLEITGDVEMVQSQQTGKFYATTRKCSIPTTFDEATAKALVGSRMEGCIVKQQCEPYSYTVESTGEVVRLDYSYEYRPENDTSISISTNKLELVEA